MVQPQKKISQALLRPLPNGSYKCRGCAQCNNMMCVCVCEYFCHPHTGKQFQINDIMCATTHVIYIIKCPCGLCYVGKTSCSPKQRIRGKKVQLGETTVAVHFNDLKHDISTFLGEKIIMCIYLQLRLRSRPFTLGTFHPSYSILPLQP